MLLSSVASTGEKSAFDPIVRLPAADQRLPLSRLPAEFWRILHFECGIIVYPSAMVEEVNIEGVGRDRAFLDAYAGHIGMPRL
jgi:hypothetical protein